jgi:hypothetical protein
MRDPVLAVIAAGAFAVGAAWTLQTLTRPDNYCPGPSSASVVALLASCQAFDAALGDSAPPDQVFRMGLRWKIRLDPASPPPTRFAEK